MKNLIELFPDATRKIQEKFQLNQQLFDQKFNIIERFPNDSIRIREKSITKIYDKGNVQFPDDTKNTSEKFKMSQKDYDNLFKKRHFKLFLILFGCLVTVYILIAQSPGFFERILR